MYTMAETTRHPETLSRDELIYEIGELLAWSLSTEFYPGKIDHPKMKRLQSLNEEWDIRRDAI